MIQPRQTIRDLEAAYTPPLEGRRERVRLDFNENTQGFPPCYGQEPATLYTAYPEYQAFIETLADAWNIPSSCFLLTNGSGEALFLAAFTFIEPGQEMALTVTPTFGLIPHYLKLVGSRLVEIPYGSDFQYDRAAIGRVLDVQNVKLAVFASPDNPTGATLPVNTIRDWCEAYPNTLFVIDEAYYDYSGVTALPLIEGAEKRYAKAGSVRG